MKNELSAGSLRFTPLHIGSQSMAKHPIRHPHSLYKIALFISDFVWSMLAFSTGVFLFAGTAGFFHATLHILSIAVFALVFIVLFKPCRLYNYHVIYDVKRHLTQMLMAWGGNSILLLSAAAIIVYGHQLTQAVMIASAAVFMMLLVFLRNLNDDYSTLMLFAIGLSFILVAWLGLIGSDTASVFLDSPKGIIAGFFLAASISTTSRYLIVHQLFSRVLKRRFRSQTVIVGPNKEAEGITRYIIDTNAPFWIAGVVGTPRKFGENLQAHKVNLGEIVDLPRIFTDNNVTEVIITDETIDKLTLIAVLDFCTANQINIWFPPSYMPVISVKLVIDQFCGRPMIRLGTQKTYWVFNKLKHVFDALVTVPIFLVQLPVFIAIAVAVKMTSKGPVFYKPTAIGKGGRQFVMYKFRSMRQDSDPTVHKEFVTKLIKGEMVQEKENGEALKITKDDRITPVGRFIRKFSLDELPQLINVIKGEMSLIGPRPCLTYEFEEYEEWHKKRVVVRPGISGLWQVTGRSEVSFEDMILLDLYYIYNRSFTMEMNIFFETVFVVLKMKGAY